MLIHNTGWHTNHDNNGGYRLKPPQERDPQQSAIAMPTKTPSRRH
jgi:hypothetical protein